MTQVVNSRLQRRLNNVWRRRRCKQCQALYSTIESADLSAAWRVAKHSGQLEPFSGDKLFLSLVGALRPRRHAVAEARELSRTIIGNLSEQQRGALLSSSLIRKTAQAVLKRFNTPAYVRYASYGSSGGTIREFKKQL